MLYELWAWQSSRQLHATVASPCGVVLQSELAFDLQQRYRAHSARYAGERLVSTTASVCERRSAICSLRVLPINVALVPASSTFAFIASCWLQQIVLSMYHHSQQGKKLYLKACTCADVVLGQGNFLPYKIIVARSICKPGCLQNNI